LAYVPIKPEELKKLIKMSKNRPMNFAFNPGPKGADLLLLDKILAPEKLGRTAKKEGNGPKAAYGTFDLHGRKLTVTAIFALPEMARKLRKYLKTLSFSFSIEVVDGKGQSLESDLSEEDLEAAEETKSQGTAEQEEVAEKVTATEPAQAEQATEENTANAQNEESKTQEAAVQDSGPREINEDIKEDNQLDEAAARRKALTNRVRALQGPISDLGNNGAQMKKAIALAVGFLKEGSFDKAEMTLGKIEESLAKAQAASATDAGADASNTAPDPKALIARAGSLKKVLDQSQGPETEAIKKQMVQALALLKNRDFAGADAGMTRAEDALNGLNERATDPQGATATPAEEKRAEQDDLNDQNAAEETVESTAETSEAKSAENSANAAEETDINETKSTTDAQAEWAAIIGPLQAEVDAAMQAKSGDLDAINRAFNYAKSQAKAGAHESALKAAENTRKLLKEAAEAPEDSEDARVAEAMDVTPDNVVAYRKSRLNWINTRNGLYADLVKLKMTIDAKAREIEGLEDIAQNTSALVDYLEDLDSALEDKLNALVETPDGAERQKLKEESIKIIRDYRSTLD